MPHRRIAASPHRRIAASPHLATLVLALGLIGFSFTASDAEAQPSWYTPPDSTGELTEQGLNRQAHRSGAPVVVVKSEEAAAGGGILCSPTGHGENTQIPGYVQLASSYNRSSARDRYLLCYMPVAMYTARTEISAINSTKVNQASAYQHCDNLIENGHQDWRLPYAGEYPGIASIFEQKGLTRPLEHLWSGTYGYSSRRYSYSLGKMESWASSENNQLSVLCVRTKLN